MPQRILIPLRAWRILVTLVGGAHALVGAAMILNGPRGLEGSVFDATNSLPWWGWGSWALTSGLLILTGHGTPLRVAGCALTASWYSLWAAGITIGVLSGHGPFYAIPVYLFLAALHVLVLVAEWWTRG